MVCENCNNTKKIEDNVLIYQTKYKASEIDDNENLEYLSMDIYQRKILNECPNKSCKQKKTEVVIYRDTDFNCFYICTTCKTKIEPSKLKN